MMNHLRLSTLFSDYAVFPKGLPICVYGSSDREGEVTLTLADGEVRKARFAPQNGSFSVLLPMVDRYTEEATLTVRAGDESFTASHIAIGIVLWACGQSNMEFRLSESERPSSLYPSSRMRFYTEKNALDKELKIGTRPMSDHWFLADGEKELSFSAIGYFTAEYLSRELSVTVGVISCNQGASRIEAWMSPEAEKNSGAVFSKDFLLDVNPDRPFNYDHWLYYHKYLNIAFYTATAVLWYQGESNSTVGEGKEYGKLLHALFDEWRAVNPNHELPFYLVELAPFDSIKAGWPLEFVGDWASVREEIIRASMTEKNVYAVSLTPVSNIAEIHPLNKYPVAEKLARAILTAQFDYDLTYTGPTLSSFTRDGDLLSIRFLHAEGLVFLDETGVHTQKLLDAYFEMADGSKQKACAEIKNRELWLTVPEGAVAFSLGYQNAPAHNLFNGEGYLASPFRISLV